MLRRVLPLLVLPALFAGCVESDIHATLKADGSGTMGTSVKFTEGMVKIMKSLEKKKNAQMDPSGDFKKEAFKMPDDARKAELAKAGLTVLAAEVTDTDTNVGMKASFGFTTIAALELVDSMERMNGKTKKGSGAPLHLTRDSKGVYTLALEMKNEPEDEDEDEDEMDEPEEMEGDEGGEMEEGEAEDPAEAMKLMGEIMGEASKLKMVFGLTVPGTIVDFAPATGGAKDGSSVTWTLDMGAMMSMQMEGGGEDGMNFKVRFTMPEGESIPDAALYSGPTKKEDGAEKAAPPEPMGGK